MQKALFLLSILVSGAASAQTATTDCYTPVPGMSSCRTDQRPQSTHQPIAAPDILGAYLEGKRLAAQEQALRQQAELTDAQRQNLELQNQLLRQQLDERQRLLSAEAAVIRQALAVFVEEQSQLPEDKRLHENTAIGKRISELTQQRLGYEPSAEAFQLAVKQLQTAPSAP